MVMFHHLPYSEAQRRGTIQKTILDTLTAHAETIEQVDMKLADELIRQRLGDTPIET